MKRADDTEILLREMTCHHVDSDRGSTALRRLNFIHGQYQISNEAYLYTLALFILEPPTWTQKCVFLYLTPISSHCTRVAWNFVKFKVVYLCFIRDVTYLVT